MAAATVIKKNNYIQWEDHVEDIEMKNMRMGGHTHRLDDDIHNSYQNLSEASEDYSMKKVDKNGRQIEVIDDLFEEFKEGDDETITTQSTENKRAYENYEDIVKQPKRDSSASLYQKKKLGKLPKRNDFQEECALNFQNNPRPRKLGNFYCFWYNKDNKPLIVIGPDWIFSIIEIVVANVIAGYFLRVIDMSAHPLLLLIGFLTLIGQNITFLLTVLANPGLPYRDPSIHSAAYLNKVKILRPHLYCQMCKVIYRQDVQTEHCNDCGFCIEELDHHCPWSSKCIGKGNMTYFKCFLFMTVSLIVFLFSGGMIIVTAN